MVRVSLTYQNYKINAIYKDPTLGEIVLTATVESSVGFNNYISIHQVKHYTVTVNSNKLQVYCSVEMFFLISYYICSTRQGCLGNCCLLYFKY